MDDFRDERGRLKPGAPPLYKGKQQAQPEPDQSDTSPLEPLPSDPNDSDAAILFVARNYGRSGLPEVGLIGYYVKMMDERSPDFHAQHSKAVARAAEAAQAIATGTAGVEVIQVGMIPSNHYVTAEQMKNLMHADLSGDASPDEPPVKPTLVVANPPIEDDAAANEMDSEFVESDDDTPEPPPRPRERSWEMNDMLRRSTPKPKWTKKRDDEPWD